MATSMHESAGIEESAITGIVTSFLGREGPLLPILHAIQAEFGHVPENAVPVIAQALNLSRAEVHGTVSFYHDFRDHKAGRTVLRLCRAEACQSRGANRVAAQISRRLGIGWHETTPDGGITLEPVFCLGLCAAAPCAMVDARPVARLDGPAVASLLESLGVPA